MGNKREITCSVTSTKIINRKLKEGDYLSVDSNPDPTATGKEGDYMSYDDINQDRNR